jgi:hypothetical protein
MQIFAVDSMRPNKLKINLEAERAEYVGKIPDSFHIKLN